jgi:cysteine-rich repeat protein
MARAARVGLACVLAVAAAAGCGKSDSIVVVNVVANQDVAGVYRLRAVVSNAGDGVTRIFPPAAAATPEPVAFPTAFSLTVPRDRTGALDIALEGLDADGVTIASGANSVDLHVGDNVAFTIDLRAGASTCGNGQRDADEECDDGDRITGGSCDYLCRALGAGPGTGGVGGAGSLGGGGGMGGGGGGMAGAGGAAGRCTIELLTNGNFDGNVVGMSGWIASDPTDRPLVYDQTGLSPTLAPQAHSPPNMAWLGDDVYSATITLSQNIVVPANAVTLTVTGVRQIRTDEDTDTVYDTANLTLQNDAVHQDLRSPAWSNRNPSTAWLDFTLTTAAAPFAGGNATFAIHVELDEDVATSFFFDSLSVVANVCPQ